MSIQKIISHHINKLNTASQNLRPGQIIQGKILKLFPNNKAQILLGSQNMIAQLEASLEIGARYHFQVKGGESVVYLKVIGDLLKAKSQLNAMDLLQQLGLKQTKANQSFVEGLLQNKIPFEKVQLEKAFPIFEGAPNKALAQSVLREMIANRLPITNNLFQALSSRVNDSFSNQLTTFSQALNIDSTHSTLKDSLMTQLTQFTVNGNDTKATQLVQLAATPAIFNMLKATGLIDRDVSLTEWNNLVKLSIDQKGTASQLDIPKLSQAVQQLVQNSNQLRLHATEVLQTWGDILHSSHVKGQPITEEQYVALKQDVLQKLAPFTQNLNAQLQNTPMHLRNLMIDLEILANNENHTKLEHAFQGTIKDQFLEQTRNVLQHTGLNYEKTLVQEQPQQTNTIKGMLLQLIQQSDGSIQEQASKLLHFIHGLQLQSVTESDALIQANLVIPAEKLGLRNDMELEFEGKKNEAGEINPDYCRIVFYLDLSNLKKTVIDMNVQKRTISLTILNDHHTLSNVTNTLKPLLKEGLEKLDYQLSTITIKPFSKQHTESTKTKYKETSHSSYQGVDFRI